MGPVIQKSEAIPHRPPARRHPCLLQSHSVRPCGGGKPLEGLQQRQLSEKALMPFFGASFCRLDRRDKGRNTLSFSVTSFSHSEHAAIGKRELFRVENVDLKLCV